MYRYVKVYVRRLLEATKSWDIVTEGINHMLMLTSDAHEPRRLPMLRKGQVFYGPFSTHITTANLYD